MKCVYIALRIESIFFSYYAVFFQIRRPYHSHSYRNVNGCFKNIRDSGNTCLLSKQKMYMLTVFLGLLISQNEIESGKVIFSEHLPLSKLQQGIKSGTYLQGTFRASRENYLEATVWVHGDTEENKEASVSINSLHTKILSLPVFLS